MKLSVICLLLWSFGFFISFDKAHSEIESQWGLGVSIMWGSLIYLYFKLAHGKGSLVEGFGMFCLCILSLFSLFMPLEFNALRNEKLLEKRLVLFDSLDRGKKTYLWIQIWLQKHLQHLFLCFR